MSGALSVPEQWFVNAGLWPVEFRTPSALDWHKEGWARIDHQGVQARSQGGGRGVKVACGKLVHRQPLKTASGGHL